MKNSGFFGSRRQLIRNAGIGVGSALIGESLVASEPIAAGAGSSGTRPPPAAREDAKRHPYWTAEYWAAKGDVRLYMYRKRVAAPKPAEVPLPILFFVHGSSVSARPTFDLSVPGHGEYSMMNVFASLGFDTWTMDFEGYGRSTQTASNSDIKSGVDDLGAAVATLERETGQKSFNFFGDSSGALRAGAFAMAAPERVDRLVLEAVTYTGKGSPTLARRADDADFYRTHNRRKRDRAMIHSIFTRDQPGTTDPAVADAFATAELQFGDSAPTGTYLDMSVNLPLLDPARIESPVLIVRGQFDGIATLADLADFYVKLRNSDRQFVIIPNAAHSVVLSYNRRLLWHAAHAFLTMPAAEPLRPEN